MPLFKLRLKEEQSLASPDLYRQAPKDDPRALLEAANFADLVGVVRQLGELSDYAAVVFSQLHAESSKVGGRGEALAARVKLLQASMPEAEVRVFSEQDTRQLLPNPGLKWRSSPHSDQTLFTSSEPPPYISEAYMDARPPPPLHVLDQFDRSAPDGGALRRYSDPYFFKREWALAELAQAEREKKAMKARRKAKHQAERGNPRHSSDGAFAKQPSRSRRNSRSFSVRTAPTPPPQTPPPLGLPEQRQRYSVYVPDNSKTLYHTDPQWSADHEPQSRAAEGDPPSDLPTPVSQGTISPYVESSFASLGDAKTSGPPDAGSQEAGNDGAIAAAAPNGLRNERRNDEIVAVGKHEEGIKNLSVHDEERPEQHTQATGVGEASEPGVSTPELPDAQQPGTELNRQLDRDVANQTSTTLEASGFDVGLGPAEKEGIPRARRRSGRGARGEKLQKSDGETESAFPRAESFDSVTQAARVREQLEREAEGRALNGRSELGAAPVMSQGNEDASVFTSPTGKLEAEWVASARDGDITPRPGSGRTPGDGPRAPPEPANVSGDASLELDEPLTQREENGRLAGLASVPGSPHVGGDSAPGSPMNAGLAKLQQEYQQAQARLEALLRMQREMEEQEHPPETEAAAAPSATSLAVELSHSSGGLEKLDSPPPETVDIDSPPWSRTSSPPLQEPGQLRRFMESPAQPVRKTRSVLDSPGPAYGRSRRGLPKIGSSTRISPPREQSPGGFSSPTFSSPERSSPLRRPWLLSTPSRGDMVDEYRPSGLSAAAALREDRFTNGGAAAEPAEPPPPVKAVPKPPPPPPPPGILAAAKKPPQTAPPPPPPPLPPGALTITGPSSSRGAGARPADLMQAIAQHDKGKLKRVDERPSSAAAAPADRNVMLEQIKKGVNLRRTEVAKPEEKPSRPVTDINVASILERANAIRQAMQDSDDDEEDEDEEDDWLD